MSEWQARRFWNTVGVAPSGDGAGWEVTLDDRRLRTPGKLPLALPTRALAEAVAAEWQAQGEVIQSLTMPLTRAVNSAVERVRPQRAEVAAMLADYAGTDLLCYRAEAPAALAAEQAEGWDALLDWAADRWNARLVPTAGVIPVPQDAAALQRLTDAVQGLDDFGLTALHDLVTLPGSLILGLAVIDGRLTADEAHRLARIDEDHQAAQWGRDPEADEAAAGRLAAMQAAARLWALSRPDGAGDAPRS